VLEAELLNHRGKLDLARGERTKDASPPPNPGRPSRSGVEAPLGTFRVGGEYITNSRSRSFLGKFSVGDEIVDGSKVSPRDVRVQPSPAYSTSPSRRSPPLSASPPPVSRHSPQGKPGGADDEWEALKRQYGTRS